MQNLYLVYILLAASAISFLLSFYAWRKRPSQGAVPLTVMMLSIAIWSLFQALSFMEKGFEVKLFLANIRYFGIEAAPIAFYAFACDYKDRTGSVSLKKWAALLAFPSCMLVLLWTNPLHKLFYPETYLDNGLLILKNGPLFWVNMIYLYIFILIGIYLFVLSYLKFNSIYRTQTAIMTLASFIPVAANLAFNFNLFPVKDVDMTPLAFVLTGILFFIAFTQYKLLDLIPIARESLFEEMEDAVLVLDGDNRILDLNRKARELIFAQTEPDPKIIGRDILPCLERWKELGDFIAQSQEPRKKLPRLTGSGTEYYDLRISNFRYKSADRYGKLIVLRNITELEQASEDARKAREEAENANRAKSYFLANMSHEIRTPMNAVVGIVEILDTMELTKEQEKKYVKIILNSTHSLLTIINDILDFSKIEAGKMELEKSPFHLGALITETAEIFSVSAANKSLNLRVSIDERLNTRFLGDYVRLRQVLGNLIGNSVKFTEKGYIEVAAVMEEVQTSASPAWVRVTVSDTGIGIPKEKLDLIFESFKQSDNSTTRKYGGTGLGLSIARNIVELMEGTLTVESEVGKGSRFCCRIPLHLLEEEPGMESLEASRQEAAITIQERGPSPQGKVLPEKAKRLSGLKLLVTDDNQVNRELLGIYLNNWGCDFEYAKTGLEAVEKFKGNSYDMILMDVQMPEMDGLEATRKIREMEKANGRHIPVIALTAGVMQEDIENCLKAGMDTHIPKPIKPTALFNTILEISGKASPASSFE